MARWIDELSDEDLAFLKRFVLASGSLKDLATAYGISYPTVRLRLDRLIDKIKLSESATVQSHFERILRQQYADGNVDAALFKTLLAAHRKDMETTDEKNSDPRGVNAEPGRSSGGPAGAGSLLGDA